MVIDAAMPRGGIKAAIPLHSNPHDSRSMLSSAINVGMRSRIGYIRLA